MSEENYHHFGYTKVTSEKCTFTWRIEKFPMYTALGTAVISPDFESKPSGQKWCLEIQFKKDNSEKKSEEYIIINLKRKDPKAENLFVELSLSITGCFGKAFLESSRKKIIFDSHQDYTQVFCMTKSYLMYNDGGLNRLRLLPNDTLTLECDITTYDESTLPCLSQDAYETSIKDKQLNYRNEQIEWFTRFFIILFLFLAIYTHVMLVLQNYVLFQWLIYIIGWLSIFLLLLAGLHIAFTWNKLSTMLFKPNLPAKPVPTTSIRARFYEFLSS